MLQLADGELAASALCLLDAPPYKRLIVVVKVTHLRNDAERREEGRVSHADMRIFAFRQVRRLQALDGLDGRTTPKT